MAPTSFQEKIEFLRPYSACDVSDALFRLQKVEKGQVARAGFLADIVPFAPKSPISGHIDEQPKVIAPASTVQYVSKDNPPSDPVPEGHAIPAGSHYVDMTKPDTVVLIDQPAGQFCAALGGIIASRMKVLGAKAIIVNGRVRDLAELRSSGMLVWARAKSTVATGAEAKVRAVNIPISVRGVNVSPGDIVFCDPLEGIVVIPQGLLDEVISLMPKLVEADERVKEDVEKVGSVFDAFKKHRS